MAFSPKILTKIQKLKDPAVIVYPLLIIISIPVLLIFNTLWNLRSFNRDANFLIRHQASSLAESIKPFLSKDLENNIDTTPILAMLVSKNDDLISAAVISQKDNEFNLIAASDPSLTLQQTSLDSLNRFTQALDNSFAGLQYDPVLQKNVWIVTTPMEFDNRQMLLSLKIDTQTVNSILGRTSRDSLTILIFTVFATLVLLANHFIFYKRSLRTKQLEELDKLKDEFISMASHELRAPVTALVGYLEMLKEKIPQESLPAVESDLSTLNSLTNDLNSLINDLLEVSRIEQERLKIEKTPTDLNQVATSVFQKMKPLADQKGLNLEIQTTEIPKITTDPDRTRQIITNMVSNAIKYTPKGSVVISTITENRNIKITVKDTGIGIPPEEMENLFGKFIRVKDKQTKEVRGTGLGLWISKKLAQMLGGDLYAESIYGTGSSFTLSLPVTGV